mmetsp:Transcript_25822/g.57893  ORF Transcript_25822/g.57893 Transcript_25822/m.57893 type:complete len:440 (-) Transcript_25822:237-1556(-)
MNGSKKSPSNGRDRDYEGLRKLLQQLRCSSHFEVFKQKGVTLSSLAGLSPDELTQLKIPRGPLVRIRRAIETGLWAKFEATESSWQFGASPQQDGSATLHRSLSPPEARPVEGSLEARPLEGSVLEQLHHPKPGPSTIGAIGGHRKDSPAARVQAQSGQVESGQQRGGRGVLGALGGDSGGQGVDAMFGDALMFGQGSGGGLSGSSFDGLFNGLLGADTLGGESMSRENGNGRFSPRREGRLFERGRSSEALEETLSEKDAERAKGPFAKGPFEPSARKRGGASPEENPEANPEANPEPLTKIENGPAEQKVGSQEVGSQEAEAKRVKEAKEEARAWESRALAEAIRANGKLASENEQLRRRNSVLEAQLQAALREANGPKQASGGLFGSSGVFFDAPFGGAQGATPSASWTCQHCTFQNSARDGAKPRTCELCNMAFE